MDVHQRWFGLGAGPRGVAAYAALVMGFGCITSEPPSYPLYAPIADPAPRTQVARLSGYVRNIDGRDVSSLGHSFGLLPGCHVVQTPSQWGALGLDGVVVVSTGVRAFALVVRPGHQYAVRVMAPGPLAWSSGRGQVTADEKDRDGHVTATFEATSNEDDLWACKRTARVIAAVQPTDVQAPPQLFAGPRETHAPSDARPGRDVGRIEGRAP